MLLLGNIILQHGIRFHCYDTQLYLYLYFNSHVKMVSRSPPFYLQNNAKIRRILTQLDAEKLVHALLLPGWAIVIKLLPQCLKKLFEKPPPY